MKPITLKTKRLLLRRANEIDAENLFISYLSSPERSYFLCRKPHTHINQTKEFIKTWCDLPWVEEQNKFAWVIADANKNQAIGFFLVDCKKNSTIEIHYGINKDFEKKGLITEAGLAIIEWLSTQHEVKRIQAYCDLENIGSQMVLKKLGFKNTETLENHSIFPALSNSPRDCLLFSHEI